MVKAKVQPKKEVVKTPQQLAQKFLSDYKELCKKYGLQVVSTPAYKARDDGTWSLIIQRSVGMLPRQS